MSPILEEFDLPHVSADLFYLLLEVTGNLFTRITSHCTLAGSGLFLLLLRVELEWIWPGHELILVFVASLFFVIRLHNLQIFLVLDRNSLLAFVLTTHVASHVFEHPENLCVMLSRH